MSLLPGDKRAEHKRERWPRDWYVEPYEAIETLFNTVMFEDPVLHDPCCGEGRIPIVAARYGYEVTGSDLVYRGFGTGGIDFLEDWTPRATLVFNPPGAKVDGNGKILDKEYANKFVLHALQVAQQVAVIVPIPFLCGKWRGKHLYRPHPPAWILPLSARASMPPGGTDIPAKGGTADYGWIGWTRGHQGPTITIWEDLKPPVL